MFLNIFSMICEFNGDKTIQINWYLLVCSHGRCQQIQLCIISTDILGVLIFIMHAFGLSVTKT